MTFFARPDLSDEQFKQLSGSTLTLEGTTQIVSTSGLKLSDGAGGNVILTAEGAAAATDGQVLTYDVGTCMIKLATVGAGGDPVYPSSCKPSSAVSVGGIPVNYTLTGKTLSTILQDMLVPTLDAVTVEPSHSTYNINPVNTLYEVGCIIPSLQVTPVFSQGSITPYYGNNPPSTCLSSVPRSGMPSSYNYMVKGCTCPTTTSNPYTLTSLSISQGNNIISGTVNYAAGSYAVFNSSGVETASILPSGTTTPPKQRILTGIYPYFFGKISSGGAPAGVNRPTNTTICSCIIAADLSRNLDVNSGAVVGVGYSNNTISLNFNSTSNDYIWFAIPIGSQAKTCWFVDATNKGSIGGAVSAGGNLFPTYSNITDITTICWSGQTYQAYVSNYQTSSTAIMELRNN